MNISTGSTSEVVDRLGTFVFHAPCLLKCQVRQLGAFDLFVQSETDCACVEELGSYPMVI